MPVTGVRGRQILDGDVFRDDLNITTTGSAVVRKLIAGTNITFSSTGVDAGTGDVTINAATGLVNPMTTIGDIIYGGASGVATRLAAGTSGQALVSAGAAAPVWTTLTLENLPDAWTKRSVKVATTANITLSGTQTIDGIAVVALDRVLVKDQSTPANNGIYLVAAGAWTRTDDASTASEIAGGTVNVDQGTLNGGQTFSTTFKSTDTLGTTAMNWYMIYSTNDSATANTVSKLVLRDASGNIAVSGITSTGLDTFTGTTASDAGTLSAELLTSTGWTTTGWTGTFAAGYTHTTGNTSVLSNTLAGVAFNTYQVTITITGRTTGSITFAFAGVTYPGSTTALLTATTTFGFRGASTANLTITPTSDFNGTVVVSIKTISAISSVFTLKSSDGTTQNELKVPSALRSVILGASSATRMLSTSTDNTVLGANAAIYLGTGTANVFVGTYAGQYFSGGSGNTVVGASANLNGNTGNNNTFLGTSAGYTSGNGNFNTGAGSTALYALTSGNYNAVLGAQAASALTTGSYNSVLGNAALGTATASNYVVAIGVYAGRFLGNGSTSLTTVTKSIYIGAYTQALADSNTNEIVIGADATGLGSNTTSIGNAAITTTAIYGNLLVKTTTDSGLYGLDVNGAARISGATTATSFVKTSGTASQFLMADGTVATVGSGLSLTSGVLSASGGASYATTTVTSSYSETATSGIKQIVGNTTSASITVTLPAASGNTCVFIIKKSAAANLLTIQRAGTNLIDGGTTAVLTQQYESITLSSDGSSNWYIS